MVNLDPRIGRLLSGRYYCFPNGYDKPEFIGTLEKVKSALGILGSAKKDQDCRNYEVIVTPVITAYAGSVVFDECSVRVCARSHAEAIKIVRRKRYDEEGRHGVKAAYRARVLRD